MKRLTQILPVLLAVALQVMPLVRNFFTNPAAGSSFAFILRWGIGTGAALGAVDAVSGATNSFSSPSSFNGTVGQYFTNSLTLKSSGGDGGAVATITTNNVVTSLTSSGQTTTFGMPPGLTFKFYDVNSVYDSIYGTPTTPGVFTFKVEMSYPGATPVGTNITITITAPANQPPAVATQPAGTNIVQNGTVVFRVAASGTAPFTYRWRLATTKSGKTSYTAIKGATNALYSLTNVLTKNAAGYQVIVKNRAGAATSSIASLNVLLPIAFTLQASNRAVKLGTNTYFRAAVKGTAPFVYQWFKDGNPLVDGGNISGSTSNVLAVSGLTTNDNGAYTLVASNVVNTITSSNALLTVLLPPVITVPATNQSVFVSNSVTFAVVVEGTAPFKYQWLKGKTAIKGATNATFTIASAKLTDAATNYLVIISNRAGSATNPPVSLNVSAAIPVTPVAAAALTVLPPGEIDIISNGDGSVSIGFIGTPNAVYTLQATDSLTAPDWQSIGSAAAQADGAWELTDSANRPVRFYRVLVGTGN